MDRRKVVAACAEGTRAFAALFAGEGIALVCLEASEIAWSRLLTGEELSTLSEPALLPDGRAVYTWRRGIASAPTVRGFCASMPRGKRPIAAP